MLTLAFALAVGERWGGAAATSRAEIGESLMLQETDPVDKVQHANGFKIKERHQDQTETEGSSSCCREREKALYLTLLSSEDAKEILTATPEEALDQDGPHSPSTDQASIQPEVDQPEVDSDLCHVFNILNARRKTSILRAKISSSGQYCGQY